MEAVASATNMETEAAEPRNFIRDTVFRWSLLARKFLDLERRDMLEKEPTANDLKFHRKTCKTLVKIGRMYQALAADMEDFDAATRTELDSRLWQLEESWRQFQEAMPEGEADALIAKYFPE